jgi:hypothetical protein
VTSEVPATPEPAAEPAPQATPPVQAEAVPAPEQKPQEPDWRAAYVGLQRNLDRSQKRTEDVLSQNRELLGAMKVLQGDTTELVRSTLGEDKAKEMAARNAQAMAQEAARRAADAAQNLAQAQANVILGALQAAGIRPDDPAIDWANNASSVEEWQSRVIPSVQARIQQANEQRLAKERETITAKSKAEIRAEAEALTARTLKEQGVDKIDTARGTSSTNLVERIRSLKPGTPEYARFEADVAAGRLKP